MDACRSRQGENAAGALLIGDENCWLDQFHGTDERIDLVVTAGSENAHRCPAQAVDIDGHHAVVDRMINELTVDIVEVIEDVPTAPLSSRAARTASVRYPRDRRLWPKRGRQSTR